MPRIDPLDLLNCLGVLLSSNGGIKGPNEVVRVARLMLRFSKKLVSKCIYIHVLKATSTELLDQFLNEQGAYFLLLKWLTEALQTRNTPLLAEMLELVQLLPMSEVRLKDEGVTGLIQASFPYSDLAQMMQSIAQEYNDQNCRNLATQVWSRWFAATSKPDEFALTQDGILPDDMDLSIYAPDATSASYGDPLSIGMGEDVGMTMGNLTTLDMNSCAPYMENNDYYSLNPFEPVAVAMNNNMSHDNHQVYIDGTANYTNEPLQQQPQQQLQHQVLNPGLVEVNNQLLSAPTTAEWSASSGVPIVAPVVPQTQEQRVADEIRPTEITAGLPVLKIKVKGGTYVVNSTNNTNPVEVKEEVKPTPATVDQVADFKEKEKVKEKIKEKKKEKEKDKKSSSSSSKTKEESSSKSSDSKKRDRERDRDRSKSSSLSKDGSKSTSSKDRCRSSKDDRKDKVKMKGSPRTEAQSKEAKQAEKNRETLAAIKAMTPVVKLAKIPRKKVEDVSASSSDTAAAATDVLDKLAPRPKTVKTFNSKFRSTGLVEEPGKSPPVVNKKLGAASPSSAEKKSPSVKRSGSIEGLLPPADKKLKAVDDTAISAAVAAVMKKTASDIKPAVKLISPRPRPLLQDSSLFMDALEAGSKSTTEPRKRKRSGLVKEGTAAGAPDLAVPVKSQDPPAASVPPAPPAVSATPPAAERAGETSPTPIKPMFNFYQDTLETDGGSKNEEKSDAATASADTKEVKEEGLDSPSAEGVVREKMEVDGLENEEGGSSRDSTKTDMADDESPSQSDSGKPKGVLVVSQQRRRPKKSVQWRSEEELEMHHYFELDETERVNVNKLLFGEMKQAEREREKQAFQMSKTMVEEPEVEEKPWKELIRMDMPEDRVIYGENSQERKIQAARESSTLQALYFKGQLLPDTPIEADPEVPLERLDAAPTVIPLDDVTGNPESVYDHRNLPWPEPKTTPYGGPGHHPQQTQQHQPPQQYSPVYRSPVAPAPVDPYYQDRGGPAMHGGDHFGHPGHADLPHHGGGPPMHHHLVGGGRGGPPGPRGDVGGTWMAGDGSIYPDHDVARYNDGPQHRDGPPHHHRENFHHHREREHSHPRDRGGHGYNDMMGGGGYMGPPRGMGGMDGPRGPRFHGPPRGGGGRPGGPPSIRGGPSNQPCWHFMRGFCRLESRCKFLHPNNYNGAPMP